MQENGNSDVSLINKELKRTFWTKNKWMSETVSSFV